MNTALASGVVESQATAVEESVGEISALCTIMQQRQEEGNLFLTPEEVSAFQSAWSVVKKNAAVKRKKTEGKPKPLGSFLRNHLF